MRPSSQGPVEPSARAPRPIDPGVRIGHVHLRTADIDRVKAFYVGVLGFDVVAEARGVPGWGTTGEAGEALPVTSAQREAESSS